MRKKEIPEVLVRSVMSLYEGAKTSIRVESELSDEFEVKVGMHQGSVLLHFLFAVVVDAAIVRRRCGWVKFTECSESLYGRRFHPWQNGVVYKSYVRPAMLYESEAWCLKESEIEIL